MSFNYFLMNILLGFAVLLTAVGNYEAWISPFDWSSHAENAPRAKGTKYKMPTLEGAETDPVSAQSFQLIAEKNIFSPERKDFPAAQAGVPEPPKPAARPQIILYGVAIGGEFESATISNPGRTARPGERDTRTVKVGQQIGEYKLAKILPDRIAMEYNGDTFEVFLYDPKNPRHGKPAERAAQPGMVANTQPEPIPSAVAAPGPAPSPQAGSQPAYRVGARGSPSIPFNKYTYQSFAPPAPRGRAAPPPAVPSPQQPAGK
jgi:hypothetical protein